MKLSVIIPVYNAEKYIQETIESVYAQEIVDMEVICVDDCSTDDSVRVIRELQQAHDNLHLLQNTENHYAGFSRNRGIEAAAGEWIHFLDADDLVAEGAYKKLLETAEKSGADIVKGKGIGFSETGEPSYGGPLMELSKIPEKVFGRSFSFRKHPEVLTWVSVVPWNGIVRRKLLTDHNIRFNDLVCVNDRSFYNESTMLARSVVLIPEVIVRYRMQNGTSLMGRRARNFDCQIRSYEIVSDQLVRHKIPDPNRRIVLERELTDLFYWYRRYRKLPEVSESVERQTKEFAENLDMTPFEESDPQSEWMLTYRRVIGQERLPDKARRIQEGIIRRLRVHR